MDNEKVLDNTPPIIHITYPANQATVFDTITVTAYAFDNIKLDKVILYINDSIIFENHNGPYEHQWNTLLHAEDEYYTIRATAKDSAGNLTSSESIQVFINNQDNIKPNGLFLFPSTGQIVNGTIEITLQAEDNDDIAYIDLFINGDSITTFYEPSQLDGHYHFNWNTNTANEDNINTIYAKIIDHSNNYDIAGPISVTVNNIDAPDILNPQGTIVSPPAGSILNGFVDIEVNAYDNIGIANVKFIINGILKSTDSIAPYIYSWDTTPEEEDQDHTINIDIIDASENMVSLYPITVHVNNIPNPDLIAPNIIIYEPAANQTVSGAIEILTITTDNDSIDKVEFYHNYSLVHIDSSFNYSYSWDTESEQEDSEHTWYAKAFDISGNQSQTSPITVFVNNLDNEIPTGAIIYPYAGQVVSDTILIQATVNDNIGISNVQFNINNITEYIDYEDPFQYAWNTLAHSEDQEHLLSITIFDLDSNFTNHSIIVMVNNNPIPNEDLEFPFASILSPISGQTLSDTITVSGFASDNYIVSEVQFFINAELISTFNDTPYSFELNTLLLENNIEHIITMTAEDQAGNASYAQPVLININNP